MRLRGVIGLLIATLLAGGCATVPKDPIARAEFKANNDPLEPMNRRIFAFNERVDAALIKPLAEGYRKVLSRPIRDGLRSAASNLGEPLVFVNCVLQGRGKDAGNTLNRFFLNSTFGVIGFYDFAGRKRDIKKQTGDFGQTLWRWGVHDGPYVVVPVFGPRNARDGLGEGVDTYFDPLDYARPDWEYASSISAARIIVSGVDQRTRALDTLDELKKESIDYYAALRSLYRQNRAAELNGNVPTGNITPQDFYDDPGH